MFLAADKKTSKTAHKNPTKHICKTRKKINNIVSKVEKIVIERLVWAIVRKTIFVICTSSSDIKGRRKEENHQKEEEKEENLQRFHPTWGIITNTLVHRRLQHWQPCTTYAVSR